MPRPPSTANTQTYKYIHIYMHAYTHTLQGIREKRIVRKIIPCHFVRCHRIVQLLLVCCPAARLLRCCRSLSFYLCTGRIRDVISLMK